MKTTATFPFLTACSWFFSHTRQICPLNVPFYSSQISCLATPCLFQTSLLTAAVLTTWEAEKWPHKDACVLTPTSCKYVTLHGKALHSCNEVEALEMGRALDYPGGFREAGDSESKK